MNRIALFKEEDLQLPGHTFLLKARGLSHRSVDNGKADVSESAAVATPQEHTCFKQMFYMVQSIHMWRMCLTSCVWHYYTSRATAER